MRKLIVLYILLLNLFLMRDVLSISPICNEGNLSTVNNKNEKFMKDMSCLNDTKLKLKYGEKRYQDAQTIVMDGHMHAIQNSAWSILMDTISSVESLSVALNKDALFAFDQTNSFYKESTGQKHGCDFEALTKKCGGTFFLENTFKKINDFRYDKPDKNQCQSPLKAVKNHAIEMSLQTDVTSQSLNDLFTGEGWKIFEKSIKENNEKTPLQILSNKSLLNKLKGSGNPNLTKIFERVSSTPLLKQAFMSKDTFYEFKKKFTEKFSKGNKDPLRYILKMDNGFLRKAVNNEINQCIKVINYFERVACNMKQEDYAGYPTSEVLTTRFIGKKKNKNIRIIKKLKDSCINLKRPLHSNYAQQAINLGTDNLLYPYKKFTLERERMQKDFNKATCSLTKKVCTQEGDLELCQKEDLFTAYINSGCTDLKNVKNQDKAICQSKLAKRNYEYLESRKSDIMGDGSIGEKRRQRAQRERARMINHNDNELSESDPIYKFTSVENISINKYPGETSGRNKNVKTDAASFFPQEKSDAGEQNKNVNSQGSHLVSEDEASQSYGRNRLFSGHDEQLNYLGANRRGYQAQIDYNNNKLNDPRSTENDKLKQDRENAIAKALERIKELEKKREEVQKLKEEIEAKKLERQRKREEEKEKFRKEEQEAKDKIAKMVAEANKRKLERERNARLKAQEDARRMQEELDRKNNENNNPIGVNPSPGINNPFIGNNNQPSGNSGFSGQNNTNPVSQTTNTNTADQSLNDKEVRPEGKVPGQASASSVATTGESIPVAPQRHSSSGLSGILGGGNITSSMPEWNDQIEEMKKDKSIKPSDSFRTKKPIDFTEHGITNPQDGIKMVAGESKEIKGVFAAKGGGYNLIKCTPAPDDIGSLLLNNRNGKPRNNISDEEMDIHRQNAFMNTKKLRRNNKPGKLAEIVKRTKCEVIQHAKDKASFSLKFMTTQEMMEETARNSL